MQWIPIQNRYTASMKKLVFASALFFFFAAAQAQVCTVIITHVINGNQVQYYGSSPDNPTGWSWFFNGGTPLTSSQQNPVVTYAAPGQYTCALSVYGGPNNCSSSVSSASDSVVIGTTGLPTSEPVAFSIRLLNGQEPRFRVINDKTQHVRAELQDLGGKKVATVFEGQLLSGVNDLSIDAYNLTPGVYILSLSKEDGVVTEKCFIP